MIPNEEADRQLIFSFTLFKIEFNPFTIWYTIISKQISTANNILKATVLISFSFSEGIEKAS